MSDYEVLQLIQNYLHMNSITTENRKSNSNIYYCSTIINCSIVKFDIRLVPDAAPSNSIHIEFKRNIGSSDNFVRIFNKFRYFVTGTEVTPRSKTPPRSLSPMCDSEDLKNDVNSMNQATHALAEWIIVDSIQALECIGQFYVEQNKYVLESNEILYAICNVIKRLENCSSDHMLELALAITCLRQYIASSKLSSAAYEVNPLLNSIISNGVTHAAMSYDLTARREAVGLMLQLNPTLEDEVRQDIEMQQLLTFQDTSNRQNLRQSYIIQSSKPNHALQLPSVDSFGNRLVL
jgi:hypothetical protein